MTDINPMGQQPMSDDQELAKVLAGITSEAEEAKDPDDPANQPIETTQIPTPTPLSDEPLQDSPVAVDPASVAPVAAEPAPEISTPAVITPVFSASTPEVSGDLADIKKDAITELRPLVDKLSLEPQEKFDTYLLLLRSTDDKELIAPAHDAAKNIPDETRRAQALLDIIKEIDFLSGQTPSN